MSVVWLREDRGGTSGKDEQAIEGSYAQDQVVLIFMLEGESGCKDMIWAIA